MPKLSEIIKSDPKKPANKQYTTSTGVKDTTGPAQDKSARGGRFVSVQSRASPVTRPRWLTHRVAW
jgi:hypothetical protein